MKLFDNILNEHTPVKTFTKSASFFDKKCYRCGKKFPKEKMTKNIHDDWVCRPCYSGGSWGSGGFDRSTYRMVDGKLIRESRKSVEEYIKLAKHSNDAMNVIEKALDDPDLSDEDLKRLIVMIRTIGFGVVAGHEKFKKDYACTLCGKPADGTDDAGQPYCNDCIASFLNEEEIDWEND